MADFKRIPLLFALLLLAGACTAPGRSSGGANGTVQAIPYTVVHTYPHDTTAYNEGLLVHEGQLYESTGSPQNMEQTRSLFGPVDLVTGRIDVKAELDRERYFGEGIAFLDGKVYQLTFKERTVFVYDAQTFKQIGKYPLPSSEGWGLTTDGGRLILSNGTSKLLYLDPLTLKVVRTLKVTSGRRRVRNLNELEWIKDAVYANVWQTSRIVRIDTATGAVTGRLELGALVWAAKQAYRGAKELNGIAYDPSKGTVYVTGKLWPYVYELQLEDGKF